ncbi:hypothetical protein BYT27DRAFT_7122919, partial [Phlegmacium glaucopus]
VFKSPVWSGFVTLRAFNRDRSWSTSVLGPQKTGLDHLGPVYISFFQSCYIPLYVTPVQLCRSCLWYSVLCSSTFPCFWIYSSYVQLQDFSVSFWLLQTQYHIFATTTISFSSLSHYQSAHQLWIIHPRMQDLPGAECSTLYLSFIFRLQFLLLFMYSKLVCFPQFEYQPSFLLLFFL